MFSDGKDGVIVRQGRTVTVRTWLIDADPTGCVRLRLLNNSSGGVLSSRKSTLHTRLAGMGGTSSWSLLPGEATKRQTNRQFRRKWKRLPKVEVLVAVVSLDAQEELEQLEDCHVKLCALMIMSENQQKKAVGVQHQRRV